MGQYGEEIGRVSTSGKTYFFNKHTAKNGNPYLRVDTLSGKGDSIRRESLTLFEKQWDTVWAHLVKAVETLGWTTPSTHVCKVCKTEIEDWSFVRIEDQELRCEGCFESVPHFMR